MNSENKQKVLYIVTGIVLFIAIFFIAVQYENKYVVNYSEIFVDLATAGIALTAVLVTIYTFNINRKHLQKQQFESTFFNMMKQLEDIVSKLTIEEKIIDFNAYEEYLDYKGGKKLRNKIYNMTKTGRDVFEYLFNKSEILIPEGYVILNTKVMIESNNDNDNPIIKEYIFDIRNRFVNKHTSLIFSGGLKEAIKYLGIMGYEESDNICMLDHYFRYLYRIMKFVDEATFLENDPNYIDERYKYMGILRGTLSPYELVLLFYNDLSYYGNEKVKPLIEKYSMFKNLRPELLSNTIYNPISELIGSEEYINDYERYIAFDGKDNGFLRYKISAKKKDPDLFKN